MYLFITSVTMHFFAITLCHHIIKPLLGKSELMFNNMLSIRIYKAVLSNLLGIDIWDIKDKNNYMFKILLIFF